MKLTKKQIDKIVHLIMNETCESYCDNEKKGCENKCLNFASRFSANDKFIDKVNNEILTAENTEGTEKTNYSEIQTSSQE